MMVSTMPMATQPISDRMTGMANASSARNSRRSIEMFADSHIVLGYPD